MVWLQTLGSPQAVRTSSYGRWSRTWATSLLAFLSDLMMQQIPALLHFPLGFAYWIPVASLSHHYTIFLPAFCMELCAPTLSGLACFITYLR